MSILKNPFLIIVWGLVVDLLIANGYLLPEQRDLWVTGGLQLIGAVGGVTLVGIYAHHKLDQHKKEVLRKEPETINVQSESSPTYLQSTQ